MCLRPGPVHTRLQGVTAQVLVYRRQVSRHREGLLQLPYKSPGAHLPVRQDTLSDLTHQYKEQHEGEDPAQVVAREMEPGAVVNVHLGALAAPACGEMQKARSPPGGPAW